MQATLSPIKIFIFTLLLAFSMMASASQAFAVTGEGFGAGEISQGTDITLFGDGMEEQHVTTDTSGEFRVEIPCKPGESYRAKYIKDGKEYVSDSILCPETETSSSGSTKVLLIGVLGALAAGAALAVESSYLGTTGATTTTILGGAAVDPGPFNSCDLRILSNPDTTVSGGPAAFIGSPFILLGNPGNTLTMTLSTPSGLGGGVSLAGSGPGVCTDTCTAAGTTFPLTMNCGGGCGFTSMVVLKCL